MPMFCRTVISVLTISFVTATALAQAKKRARLLSECLSCSSSSFSAFSLQSALLVSRRYIFASG
uniref:RxLR effector candidate protein n=1 Tax=Hyaloperonospora arabidopsidis (strain Emoy2) TaxID=559515 RepID=M4C611_HYAAE